jgi:hypothetical protein
MKLDTVAGYPLYGRCARRGKRARPHTGGGEAGREGRESTHALRVYRSHGTELERLWNPTRACVQDVQVWRELLIRASDDPEEAYLRKLINEISGDADKVCRPCCSRTGTPAGIPDSMARVFFRDEHRAGAARAGHIRRRACRGHP